MDASLLALSIDGCLHVFTADNSDNEEEEDKKVSVLLEAPSDALAWTECNTFVIAALRSGKLQVCECLRLIRDWSIAQDCMNQSTI